MLKVHITKQYRTGGQTSFALNVDFTVGDGITVLFGPSGSGKTTVLRSIAGTVQPDAGRIELGERVYYDSAAGTHLPIQQRRIGFVFQEYLLFPHLTAAQNVAYAIRAQSAKERRERAMELLDLLGIAYAAERRPLQLSGGEQQRVTLARALAFDPAILLLDEPMSALDASTRLRLLGEMTGLQRRLRIPFLFVTHNPADAVRVGDFAIILDSGQIVQQGPLPEVLNAPQSAAGARAVGRDNVLPGNVSEHREHDGMTVVDLAGCRLLVPYSKLPLGSEVAIGVRSDDIIVSRERVDKTSARNLLAATIERVVPDGPEVDLIVDCGVRLKVLVTAQAAESLRLVPGVTLYLLIKANSCRILP